MRGKMNGKISAILAAMLVFSSVFLAIPMVKATEGSMYFDPDSVSGLALDDTFSLTVMFKDFTNLYTWQVEIGFDPAVLMAVDFVGGPYLPDSVFKVLAPGRGTLYFAGVIDNTLGYIYYSSEALTGAGGVNGIAGTGYKLMKINFKVKGFAPTGSEVIMDRGLKTFWVTGAGVKVYPATGIATISTVAPLEPYSPTAKFQWTPPFPEEGATILFDASLSKPGFDGTLPLRQITEYRWDFNAVPGWEVIAPTPITTWSYPTTGFYPVTLEVWAPGTYPPDVPDTNSTIKTVHVIPIVVGAKIDVYTQKSPYGIGPGTPSDAFAPQELVILYANVTYNSDPVPDKLVAYQVIDAAGENVIYRTDETNVNGIAMVDFRVPNSPALGVWEVIAIVDVAGTIKADTLTFKVGWIIEILSVAPGATSYKKGQTATFTLEIQSISMATKKATLTVVVYDDAGVPVGKIVVPDWPIDPESTGLLDVTIDIPLWAFVGPNARAYANAFTDLPVDNGVPYCPETFAQFIIERP